MFALSLIRFNQNKMKNHLYTFILLLSSTVCLFGQNIDFNDQSTMGNLYIRMYGHVDYNQKIDNTVRRNGVVDVHRLVTLFGYQFNARTQFVTEIEVEHGDEIFIEQAFIKHQFNQGIGLKAGVLLTPMGYINEYHEPTLFHSVERPTLDKLIVPTTWREIGIGVTGLIQSASLKYQAYLMNGFLSHDGDSGLIKGSNGLRSGRQKALRSVYSGHPNLATKLEYFGLESWKFSLSGYFGKTQSVLYNGLLRDDAAAIARADSSVVNVAMFGLTAGYNKKNLDFKTQFIYAALGNTDEYNRFTNRDLGSAMMGYYAEIAYDVKGKEGKAGALIPFARFSQVNTHASVEEAIETNENYDQTIFTFGLNWIPANGAVFKIDYQFFNNKANNDYQQFNAGIGFWF